MKKIALVGAALTALLVTSCAKNKATSYAGFVTKDTANKMIQSYLTSITHDTANSVDPDLYSLTVDANDLRTYLSDPSISKVKVMFAHTLKYVNAGNGGRYAGYKSGALTIVMAGYNQEGNYVFAPGGLVPDHASPCPRNCNVTGTATGKLLQ